MHPGTGKTITSLAVAARAHKRHGIKLLVVCPAKVISVWEYQVPQHLNMKYELFTSINKLEKARNNQIGVEPGIPTLEILVLSYGKINGLRDKLIKLGFNFVIVDESHEVKERSTSAAKSLSYVTRHVDWCLLLTGTPWGNADLDLYSQYNVMDPTLFGDWWSFQKYYCEKFGYDNRKFRLKKHREKEFMRIIKSRGYHVSEDEVSNIPVAYENIEFELTGNARKYYREFERKLATDFGGMIIKEDLAVSNLVRLQQLAGGFMKVEDDIIQLEQDKLKSLLDTIHSVGLNTKVVIFCRFIEEINIIEKALTRLNRKIGILHGKTKDLDIWQKFQEDPEMTFFVCQIKTGGVGIDLFSSHIGIFYSMSHSYIQYFQAVRRLKRIGQRKKVRIIHLIAKNTVDEAILSVLKKKDSRAKAVLSQLTKRRSNHG